LTPVKPKVEPRFFADVMLGSLARWLRILDYDTVYSRTVEDGQLVEACVREGRIALTKDRRLVQRSALRDYLLIQGIRLGDQLREVLAFTGDRPEERRILGRCLECNAPIVELSRELAESIVPPYVFGTQDHFRTCPECGKVYWAGTHRERMLERLKELVGGEDAG